ncbi:MAG: hypothetical protein JSU91_09090 [Thermoplasmatales archaeon]|nr:MAG: hypothetical protein JSU91_09090 [Thermoplasmatales archaeon]
MKIKKNKIYAYIGIITSILMLLIPSISATDETNSSNEVYGFGRLFLVSPDIEGIEEGIHFGGLHDLNITIRGGNTFILRTRPIWGSTFIADYVDINIQMKNFFGFADIYMDEDVCQGILIGRCEDISWEKI